MLHQFTSCAKSVWWLFETPGNVISVKPYYNSDKFIKDKEKKISVGDGIVLSEILCL